MAQHLDLEEQEQLAELKHFWNRYGNLITWALIAVFGSVAAWNGWQYWQREQAVKAGAMFDELERAATAADVEKTGRVFNDLKERFPRTAFAHQAALLTAKAQFDKGQTDAAQASLEWLVKSGADDELRTVAQLRLAALHAQAKRYDEALKTLDAASALGFEGLVADRRGDVLGLQGKKADAVVAYQAAYKALGEKLDYRRLVEAKLTALGAPPAAAALPTVTGASPLPAAAASAAAGASR